MIGEEGEEIVKKIDDIDDQNHYSIELEKQKAEHDRMVKLAEEKKQVIIFPVFGCRRLCAVARGAADSSLVPRVNGRVCRKCEHQSDQ